ncbi:CRISPR-associated helicase Cas3' [Candidatus Micrarchaeota archaeon]|nr:CRISPR-associated helicase Cas3' [Candidatus Micrarchaeota archaeon]
MEEHTFRTKNRFITLCESGLEPLVDSQIKEAFTGDHEKIKEFLFDIVCLHDLGKLNPTFQEEKMGNRLCPGWEKKDSNHSELGWVLFQFLFWDKLGTIKEDEDFFQMLILTTVISGHHTYAWGVPDCDKRPTLEFARYAAKVASVAGWDVDSSKINSVTNFWREQGEMLASSNRTKLFPLYKTLYSALILSDSSATLEASGGSTQDTWSIGKEDVKRWRMFFSSTKHSRSLNAMREEISSASPKELMDLNKVRAKILLETQDNLEEGLKQGKRLFYLEAPTGSGKTNCAINLALRALEMDNHLRHAIFVFPFVNLIEQNAQVIRDSIGAKPGDILEVHSLAEWGEENEDYEKEKDQRLFLNGKISITSSVNFLEALGSSRKKANYKLCNISNSVIVLDEIQSIDDVHWTYLEFLLDSFAKANNCYIILMSATLPRVDRIGFTEKQCGFAELLDYKEYPKHPCFMGRTDIIFKPEVTTVEELRDLVGEILSIRDSPTKLLIVVNTIRRSREVFEILTQNPTFETNVGTETFKVRLLNSQLLQHIKKSVISEAKYSEGNLIVVSTQCIEAGVDADFDAGIRDFAILDSIEQVAGRVNRNASKPKSSLFVVNLHRSEKQDAQFIYGGGRRWDTLKRIWSDVPTILGKRDYAAYYNQLVMTIQEKNRSASGVDVLGRTETKAANTICLYKLKDFQVIKDDGLITCFIPVDVPISDVNFSKSELNLIPSAVSGAVVKGEQVWEEYQRIKDVGNRDGLIRLAAFSTILAKFTVNRRRAREEWGKPEPILFLDNWRDVYDLSSGFKEHDGFF